MNTTSAFLSKDVRCWWLTGTDFRQCVLKTGVIKWPLKLYVRFSNVFFQNPKTLTFYVFWVVTVSRPWAYRTAEPLEMPFGARTCGGARKHALGEDADNPSGLEGAIWGNYLGMTRFARLAINLHPWVWTFSFWFLPCDQYAHVWMLNVHSIIVADQPLKSDAGTGLWTFRSRNETA